MALKDPDKAPRFCHHCNKELYGRADQKYCNDDCRSAGRRKHLREEKWYEPYYIQKVNRILGRNYRILHGSLMHKDPRVVTKSQLIEHGFDFRYFTSSLNTNGGTYYYCYIFGYKLLENGKYLLVINLGQVDI